MAAPTFQSATSAASVASGALTLTYPGSLAVGDIVVACITIRGTTGFTTPTGWTNKTESLTGNTATSNGIASAQVFWRRIDGTEGASQVFSRTGGDLGHGSMLRYTGCLAVGDPFDTFSITTVSGTTGALVPTNITTTVPDTALIWFNALADNGTVSAQAGTTPASWTERVDNGTNTGADGGININTGTLATATTTSGISATSSINGTHVVVLLALAPNVPNDVLVRRGSASSVVSTALTTTVVAPSLAMGMVLGTPTVTVDCTVTAPQVTMTSAVNPPTGNTGAVVLNDVLVRRGGSLVAPLLSVTVTAPGLSMSLVRGTPNTGSNFIEVTPTLPPMGWMLMGSDQQVDVSMTPDAVPMGSALGTPNPQASGSPTATPPSLAMSWQLRAPILTLANPAPSLSMGWLLGAPVATASKSDAVTAPSLAMGMALGTPTVDQPIQNVVPPSLAMGMVLGFPFADDGSAPVISLLGKLAPQRNLIDVRTDVRANLSSSHLARLERFESCTYTDALDHSGTCELEVSPNASYLAELRQGRVIRITDRRSNVLEYRIERVTQEIDQPTVTVTAVPVIHDLNRYFLWETLGDIPAFAQGATDLTATEWLTGFVLPVLTAAGVTYVDLDTIDSERTLNLEWQGQTVMWLLNTLVEGTDLDIVYRIANPGAKVERYALSLERRGADAARPRCLVGDNAEALEWTVDGDPQANVIIPQGLLPAGGEERSNIGEYVARVTAVDGNQLTVEDPDGNPSPVYVEDQATELYLELLVPPILTGALS